MISTKHHTNRTLCEVDWIKRIRPTCKTTTRTRTSAPRGSCRPAAGFALWKSSQRRKRKCVCGLMEPGVIIGPAPRPRSPCTALCVCVCVSNQFHMFRSDSPQNYVRFVSLTLTSKIRFWFLVELRELRVSFHPDVCKQPRCQSALKQHCEALLSAPSQRTGLHTEQNHQGVFQDHQCFCREGFTVTSFTDSDHMWTTYVSSEVMSHFSLYTNKLQITKLYSIIILFWWLDTWKLKTRDLLTRMTCLFSFSVFSWVLVVRTQRRTV